MLNPSAILILVVLTYVLATDGNVAPYLFLKSKRLKQLVRGLVWTVRWHPETPWVRYAINRRAWRAAKEMRESFNLPPEDRK